MFILIIELFKDDLILKKGWFVYMLENIKSWQQESNCRHFEKEGTPLQVCHIDNWI